MATVLAMPRFSITPMPSSSMFWMLNDTMSRPMRCMSVIAFSCTFAAKVLRSFMISVRRMPPMISRRLPSSTLTTMSLM